jgi:hypothetical protein
MVQAGNVGSFELSQFENHVHANTIDALTITRDGVTNNTLGNGGGGAGGSITPVITNVATGGSESRPVNASIAYFIKY